MACARSARAAWRGRRLRWVSIPLRGWCRKAFQAQVDKAIENGGWKLLELAGSEWRSLRTRARTCAKKIQSAALQTDVSTGLASGSVHA
jgi:hypothetical protein